MLLPLPRPHHRSEANGSEHEGLRGAAGLRQRHHPQAALPLLEQSGAISTTARGRLGTFLVRSDRTVLWRLSGLGTLLAAMPLPYSRRYEGLATGLRGAFEEAGAPFAVTFMRGAGARTAALLEGKVDLVVLSRFAAGRLTAEHPVELVADLGPATYVGAHGMLVRRGTDLEASGLRVAIDHTSEDLRMLVERVFAGREDIVWRETTYVQLPGLFSRDEVDATVSSLDEAQDRIGPGVEVLPLGDEVTRELALRNSGAAVICRTDGAQALAAVRASLDLPPGEATAGRGPEGGAVPSY